MSKEIKILIRIGIVVLAFMLITSLIPALLSAASDLAVLAGTGSFIALIVLAVLRGKEIVNWFINI